MTHFFLILALIVIFYFLNNYISKFNFLSNYKGQIHQKFSGLKNIPLTGGIFFTLSSVILFYSYNYFLCIFLISIFLVGFFSDINFLSSPKLRLMIQTLLVISFVIILDINIYETKFIFLDDLLQDKYFRYFFSVFCLLILINGSNFIDGLNGLVLGYFFLIITIIFKLDYFNYLQIDEVSIINLIIVILYLFILNLNKKLFMGDSGSYVLSLVCGYFLIKISEFNSEISPYFIILLLWYPCFENLFSIIRKFSFKRSPVNADNNHFHQLVFFYLKKKFSSTKHDINNLSSYVIIFYNLIIFLIGSRDPSNTQLQIMCITINILTYLVIYFRLFIFKNKIKFYR